MILSISLLALTLIVVGLGYWYGEPDAGVTIDANEPPESAIRKGFRLLNNRKRLKALLSNRGHYLYGLYIDGVEWIYERVTGAKPVRKVKRRWAWGVIVVQILMVIGLYFSV